MTHSEYKVTTENELVEYAVRKGGYFPIPKAPAIEWALNRMGKNGWRLIVSTSAPVSKEVFLYLERRVETPE